MSEISLPSMVPPAPGGQGPWPGPTTAPARTPPGSDRNPGAGPDGARPQGEGSFSALLLGFFQAAQGTVPAAGAMAATAGGPVAGGTADPALDLDSATGLPIGTGLDGATSGKGLVGGNGLPLPGQSLPPAVPGPGPAPAVPGGPTGIASGLLAEQGLGQGLDASPDLPGIATGPNGNPSGMNGLASTVPGTGPLAAPGSTLGLPGSTGTLPGLPGTSSDPDLGNGVLAQIRLADAGRSAGQGDAVATHLAAIVAGERRSPLTGADTGAYTGPGADGTRSLGELLAQDYLGGGARNSPGLKSADGALPGLLFNLADQLAIRSGAEPGAGLAANPAAAFGAGSDGRGLATASFATPDAGTGGTAPGNAFAGSTLNPGAPDFLRLPTLPAFGATATWSQGLGDRLLTLADQGLQSARLKLYPEYLGELDIQIKVADGEARVWFHAQHAQAREAIESALPRLREMFAESGLDLVQAQVDSGPGRQGPGQGFGEPGGEAPRPGWASDGSPRSTAPAALLAAAATAPAVPRGRVDLLA